MASEDSKESIELLQRAMDHNLSYSSSALTYANFLAYASIFDLHRAFTKSLLMQVDFSTEMRKFLQKRNFVVAAMTFQGGNTPVMPLKDWMVTGLIRFNATDEGQIFEPVTTHPLYRQELESLMNLTLDVEECEEPSLKFWLHPSLILPRVSMEFFDLANVPEAMILPAQKGISVSLGCSATASITAYCVPRKFNQGSLTCRLASTLLPTVKASIAKPLPEPSRRPRKSRAIAEKSKFSLATLWQDFEANVRPIWSALTPDVFTCTASLAGCDFCFYYLSTYNLSVAPAACVGGCSLSAFSSCSKLIPNSFVKTLKLD